MAKDDQQDAFEKGLSASLGRIIDLIKFAEAKNAALLAFDSAWAVAIANILAKPEAAAAPFARVMPVAGALFIVSALVALFSIMPKVNLSAFYKRKDRTDRTRNLLFYGDICEVPVQDVAVRLETAYLPGKGSSATEQYLNDLAVQIQVNSCIATRKYALFKVGGWITFVALAILTYPAVAYLTKGSVRLVMDWAQ